MIELDYAIHGNKVIQAAISACRMTGEVVIINYPKSVILLREEITTLGYEVRYFSNSNESGINYLYHNKRLIRYFYTNEIQKGKIIFERSVLKSGITTGG